MFSTEDVVDAWEYMWMGRIGVPADANMRDIGGGDRIDGMWLGRGGISR